ncbi:MAG: cadmium-translocating P-type ATPase [Clostridia bacterium]|nr:cadmium-translocating P-type ATPase [Clostridia bacterium]
MKKTLKIVGLDCAVCAGELEDELNKIEGVKKATVVFATGKLLLDYDGQKTLEKVIDTVNGFEEAKIVEETQEKRECRLFDWLKIALSAVFLIGGVCLEAFGVGTVAQIFTYILYGLAYLAVGYSVLIATVKNIAKGRIFDENFLMTLASIGAMCIGEFWEGVLVMLLYQLGELLQAIAVGASRNSVTKLMELKSESATRVNANGEQETVAPEALNAGDTVLVKKGERIACDGVLESDNALLDTKSLTGEAAYRDVEKGGELLAGCVNAGNAFTMKITRNYENSAVKKILDIVENSMAHKAAPEKFITKFAKIYTPVVCVLAVCLAVFPPLITGLATQGAFVFVDWQRWLTTALTFLVISCPCALVISVPLTYFSGIGACAKRGILAKGAVGLDIAAGVKLVAFDKTGTLTRGNFGVSAVRTEEGVDEAEMLAMAAALERFSSHPIAGAFAHLPVEEPASAVEEIVGKGLKGEYKGKTALIGTLALMEQFGVDATEKISADTVLYLSYDGKFQGTVEIGDAIREESKDAVEQLHSLGIRVVMLTGDTPARAQNVALRVGMASFKAGLLPAQKVAEAENLKAEARLLYVGDGINDAPVMTVADCSVSMGSLGSAAAVEASDFVLVSDRLSAIPQLLHVAKKTKNTVVQNVVFSIVMKALFMLLGVFGVLPLWAAVFADVGVMLLAVLNAMRVKLS